MTTKTTIYPGQAEEVVFSVALDKALRDKELTLYVIVDDDGKGAGSANECKEDNNEVTLGQVTCKSIG